MENYRNETKFGGLAIMLSKIQRYFNKNTIRADVFISAGGACRPAHYLRKHRLRTFSSPFDWMMCYKLEHIIYFLQNGGQGFFTKIKEIRQNETNDNRFIQDSQTGMVSMHDFLRSQSIEECYTEFIHKHKRRFIQLKNEIKKSQTHSFYFK